MVLGWGAVSLERGTLVALFESIWSPDPFESAVGCPLLFLRFCFAARLFKQDVALTINYCIQLFFVPSVPCLVTVLLQNLLFLVDC